MKRFLSLLLSLLMLVSVLPFAALAEETKIEAGDELTVAMDGLTGELNQKLEEDHAAAEGAYPWSGLNDTAFYGYVFAKENAAYLKTLLLKTGSEENKAFRARIREIEDNSKRKAVQNALDKIALGEEPEEEHLAVQETAEEEVLLKAQEALREKMNGTAAPAPSETGITLGTVEDAVIENGRAQLVCKASCADEKAVISYQWQQFDTRAEYDSELERRELWKSIPGAISAILTVSGIDEETYAEYGSLLYRCVVRTEDDAEISSEAKLLPDPMWENGEDPLFGKELDASVSSSLEHGYRITIPANYVLHNYTSATGTSYKSANQVNAKSSSYRLYCTARYVLSDGTVRYRWKSGDNPPKTLYFTYDSSRMSIEEVHSYSNGTCNCGAIDPDYTGWALWSDVSNVDLGIYDNCNSETITLYYDYTSGCSLCWEYHGNCAEIWTDCIDWVGKEISVKIWVTGEADGSLVYILKDSNGKVLDTEEVYVTASRPYLTGPEVYLLDGYETYTLYFYIHGRTTPVLWYDYQIPDGLNVIDSGWGEGYFYVTVETIFGCTGTWYLNGVLRGSFDGQSYEDTIILCDVDAVIHVEHDCSVSGHLYDYIGHVDPTCTEQGYDLYSCIYCGADWYVDFTDPLGHNYSNGACTRCGAAQPGWEKEGSCGSGLSYKVDNGKLIISGSGTLTGGVWPNYAATITSVTIPEGVTAIGDKAFSGFTKLSSVTIPSKVTSIGANAFSDCTALKSVKIPDSVKSIGNGAFKNCTSLTSVTLPANLTSIANNMFYGCSKLASVRIPDSVTAIGSSAFTDCKSMTYVTIPLRVKKIGDAAFRGCTALKDVLYGGTAAQWKSVSIGSSNEPLKNALLHPVVTVAASKTKAKINWTAMSGATGYVLYIYKDNGTSPVKTVTIKKAKTLKSSYTMTAGHTFRFTLAPVINGKTGMQSLETIVTVPLDTPKLKAKVKGNTLSLSWSKVKGADGYELKVTDSAGTTKSQKFGSGTKKATLTVSPTGAYTLSMTAYTALSTSNTATVRGTVALTATSLKAKASKGTVALSWKQVKTADAYEIYRAEGSSTSFKLIATVSGSVKKYVDSGVSVNKTYTYKLRPISKNTYTYGKGPVYGPYTAAVKVTVAAAKKSGSLVNN